MEIGELPCTIGILISITLDLFLSTTYLIYLLRAANKRLSGFISATLITSFFLFFFLPLVSSSLCALD